jgi:glucuronate isomerase
LQPTSTGSAQITGEDTGHWSGYLEAHRKRRAYFRSFGATSSDHGHPTAETANLLAQGGRRMLFDKVRTGHGRCARQGPVPRPDAHRNGPHEHR